MKILVAYKRVVDYNVRIQVKPDGSGVVTDGVKLSPNPFDEIALEEALRLRDKGIASEVVVATIAPADAQAHLRNGLAMGANRAIHVVTDQAIQPLTAARTLLKLIEKEQPDLVILGKQAIDDDANQTGQMLATLWGRPQATFASKLDADGKATVTREVDAGLETLEVDLPAVVTTDLRLNEPRFIKLPDIMKAKAKPLETLQLADLGVEAADTFKTTQYAAPSKRSKGVMVKDAAELVAALKQGAAVMSRILVIAEHHDGKLNAATAKTVSAAAAISGASIDVLVLAADPAAVAAEAAKIAGVAKVLTVANAANAQAIAQVLAPQIAQLAKGYTHVFGPSTTFGKDLMPRVAALLGVNQVSDLMSVEGSHTFKRPIYAGNAIITVEAPADQIVVATVRAASWPEAAQGGSAAVEAASVDAALPTHTRFVGLAAGASDRPDLQSAKRVVSGGRGVGSEENFKVIFQLADKLGAAVGASRAAVDAGYVPSDLQVGQTGKIIAPELYVASASAVPSST
jgi:electron transfer flavoprotein alpha subunit